MNEGIPESDGLICAFELSPTVTPRLRGWDAAALEPPPKSHALWMHFNLADTRARRWLENRADIPETARESLLDHGARVHAQTVAGGVVVVLSDLHHDFRADPEGFGLLHVYMDEQRVLTGRRHALKSVDQLRRAMLGGLEVASPVALFEELIVAHAVTFAGVVARLGDEVDEAEDRILAGRLHDQGTALGRMRRLLARLRRHVGANRTALATLLSHLPRWCEGDARDRWRQAADHLETVAQDIELVQERTRLLQEEIAGRLTEATNRNLFLLSMLTGTFLPVTLITGVFGMNVGGLPWLNNPQGFWWVVGVMGTAVVTTVVVLRRWRIF